MCSNCSSNSWLRAMAASLSWRICSVLARASSRSWRIPSVLARCLDLPRFSSLTCRGLRFLRLRLPGSIYVAVRVRFTLVAASARPGVHDRVAVGPAVRRGAERRGRGANRVVRRVSSALSGAFDLRRLLHPAADFSLVVCVRTSSSKRRRFV